MYLVRYARHGCSFPQQGIAGCVVSLMVDSGCRRKRGGFPNNEVNKHRATCTDQMRKRAHDLCGLKDQASDTISGSITGSTNPLAILSISRRLRLPTASSTLHGAATACPARRRLVKTRAHWPILSHIFRLTSLHFLYSPRWQVESEHESTPIRWRESMPVDNSA